MSVFEYTRRLNMSHPEHRLPESYFLHEPEIEDPDLSEATWRKAWVPEIGDGGAYEPTDPKHPSYHSAMSDLWDCREGK